MKNFIKSRKTLLQSQQYSTGNSRWSFVALIVALCLSYLITACVSKPGSEGPEIWAEPQFSVQATLDVKYAEGLTHSTWLSNEADSMDLLLDIFQPEDADSLRPAVVFIHGGGFTGGDKSHSAGVNILEYFVQRGFVGFSINYRLAGDFGTIPEIWNDQADEIYLAGEITEKQREQAKAMYPAARDAKAAIRWIYANAGQLGIDTNYMTVMGGSAGAFITMGLGVTEEADYRDELTLDDDPTLASTNLNSASKVHTLIDFWGGPTIVDLMPLIMGTEERWDGSDAPVCIIHGTNDQTVPYELALEIESHYQQTGAPYHLYTLEGAGHGPWNATYQGNSLSELAFDFVLDQQDLHIVE